MELETNFSLGNGKKLLSNYQ